MNQNGQRTVTSVNSETEVFQLIFNLSGRKMWKESLKWKINGQWEREVGAREILESKIKRQKKMKTMEEN